MGEGGRGGADDVFPLLGPPAVYLGMPGKDTESPRILTSLTSGGHIDECRLDLSKSLRRNDLCKKGLSCVDGVLATQPSLARRPKDGIF